jgi:hypothetical protein
MTTASVRNQVRDSSQEFILLCFRHIPEYLGSDRSSLPPSHDHPHLIPDYRCSEGHPQDRRASHKAAEQLHGHRVDFCGNCVAVQCLMYCDVRGVSEGLGLHADFDGNLGNQCSSSYSSFSKTIVALKGGH